jgi:hypothetical protein
MMFTRWVLLKAYDHQQPAAGTDLSSVEALTGLDRI